MADESDEAVDAAIAMLRNRALRLLRTGSSSDLCNEAEVLNRYLYSRLGRQLQSRSAEVHARLRTIADMLSEASRRVDSVFLSAVLSSHKKYAEKILEILSPAGTDGVPRQKLLGELEIEQSHLSHVLADLEDADVIVRYRHPGKKEVRVAIGPAGRELIATTLMPAWFLRAADYLQAAIAGSAIPSASKVVSEMQKAEVPSRIVTDRVIQLLGDIGNRRKAPQVAAEAGVRAR